MENQAFQQENKNLISKVRKNSNKKKKNFKWISILWVFGVIAIAVLILFLVFNALKPIQHDPFSSIVTITLDSDQKEANSESIKNVKSPADKVPYSLFVKNDLENVSEIFLRFKPVTYLEDQQTECTNIMKIFIPEDNKDKFIYYCDDNGNEWYYYLGVIKAGEQLTICEQIGTKEETSNEFASKTVNFFIKLEAIKVPENLSDIIWNDATSQQWRQHDEIKAIFEENQNS